MKSKRIQIILKLLLFVPLLISSARAEEIYYSELMRIFDSDLTVDASYQSSNKDFFWVTINEVLKGDEYGLSKGDRLKIVNQRNSGCGFPYDVSEYKRMRLCLVNKNHQWELFLQSTSSVSPVINDTSLLGMRDQYFRVPVRLFNSMIKELVNCYTQIDNSWRFHLACSEESLNQKVKSNILIAQLEKQGRSEEELPVEVLRERIHSTQPSVDTLYCSFIDQPPVFPEGKDALHQYLLTNARMTKVMLEREIEGTVMVEGIITEKGKTANVFVKRGILIDADSIAVNAMLNMPEWKPATQGGRPVACKMMLPFRFRIIR